MTEETWKDRKTGIGIVEVTADELFRRHRDNIDNLEELREIAAVEAGPRQVCDSLPEWKYAGLGMCFSCTTGESDASNDYELVSGEAP